MKKLRLFSIAFIGLWVCSISGVNAQGVGVNSSGNPADSSAILDVNSTTKGQLLPRMTTVQRDAIYSPAAGLTIYNTDCHTININAGTPSAPNWVAVILTNSLAAAVTIVANPLGAVCSGASITFTAFATNGGTSPTYQWKVNGGNVGTNSSTYTTTTINNGDVISCELTSNAACITGSPATSNAIPMFINASPTITGTTPASNCGTGTVTLGATTTAGIINWYDVLSGGTSLGTGISFTTPSISSTTTYYVDAIANGCTTPTRTAVTASVYSSLPAQPGSISGPTTNLGSQTGVTYSISPVNLAASYAWTVPSGATITGGQGTASIIVNFGCSASGNITIIASNTCGSSSQQTLSVSTLITTPSNITGPNVVSPNATGMVYSIDPFLGAISYNWTVPSGASITANTGTSITVNFGADPTGNITVSATNSCGTSGLSTAPIYALASPLTITYSGVPLTFTVPSGVTSLTIEAWGAKGGTPTNWSNAPGGKGAYIKGTVTVISQEVLKVLVGQAGGNGTDNAGGGGGSFVIRGTSTPLVIAGGGGGGSYGGCSSGNPQGKDGSITTSGTDGYTGTGGAGGAGGTSGAGGVAVSGSGGGGLSGSGGNGSTPSTGGVAFTSGGAGGHQGSYGGYGGFGGGGGEGNHAGGGGGGYSGGGGGAPNCPPGGGGGGGSYNAGTSQTNTAGVQTGNGKVILTW